MLNQLLSGGLVSLVNFGIHALMTGLIVVATHHIAAATDDLHVFARVTSLMIVTLVVLMVTHVIEIAVWASYYAWAGIETEKAGAFEFAFENYTALGYGDAVAGRGLPADRADHLAQRTAPDRLVGRHHLRGHADGRGADRRAKAG